MSTYKFLKLCLFLCCCFPLMGYAQATSDVDAADDAILRWAAYFSNSTLTEEERIAELRWFVEASEPFRGRT
ncbi:MAG: hypothetical protein H7175_19595, partial [Burkholderiales bacterium]|nr:hypothetical protein [Anaerolineae bacterium]